MVTLKTKTARPSQLQAGDAVTHLDRSSPATWFAVPYTESLAFQVVPKASTAGLGERAAHAGRPPESATGNQLLHDRRIRSGRDTYCGAPPRAGIAKSSASRTPGRRRSESQIPGDVVQVTYSETLALKLEQLGAR